ncbi:MAG: helix-turn-helix domain-containing protein [Oscillospiraceae bacterium]|nr:helix-turn-helix domain-containing protein [Oscillospiraceae bacterium]
MNVGTKIRTLRRARELTQEELAVSLGVSFQAVSKWERGDGYPDITLLPHIAGYFNVSLDELLGADEEHKEADIAEARKEHWRRQQASGDYEADDPRVIAVLDNASDVYRNLLKKHPNDYNIMLMLAGSLENERADEHTTDTGLWEAISLYERIAKYATDEKTRVNAQTCLAHALFRAGERERAELEAMKLSDDFMPTRRQTLMYVTRGEQQLRHIQSYIEHCALELFHTTRFAAPRDTFVFPVNQDVFGYTNAERIKILQTGINALELLREDGEPRLMPFRTAYYYRSMALLALWDNDRDTALFYLEKAADCAIECDARCAVHIASAGEAAGGREKISLLRTAIGEPVIDGGFACHDLLERLTDYPVVRARAAERGEKFVLDESRALEAEAFRAIYDDPRLLKIAERLRDTEAMVSQV